MLSAFFRLAALSPSRRIALRAMLVAHVLLAILASMAFAFHLKGGALLLGNVLLIAGIIEGALLLGWRLAQMPMSQALEFLLVSPVQPRQVFLAEAAVGLARLAIVTLSSLPLLMLLANEGYLAIDDVATLLLVPFTWGSVTGLGLAVWAYEPDSIRKIGERCLIACILVYLVVGMLAAENLVYWLRFLPDTTAGAIYRGFRWFHEYNPFGIVKFAMEERVAHAWPRIAGLCMAGLGVSIALLARGSCRLKGHFHDRHYRPAADVTKQHREPVGDSPLSWWAVKRVTQYAGRINLWLAGGFGALYAVYIALGADWPSWLGKEALATFDRLGGVPVLSTALVLLAAVPAAYQYGLWDSSTQDRIRRLELLLLTQLDGRSYWDAASAAAWKRGRGYFLVALVLWFAAWWAGQMSTLQIAASLSAGVILWGLYFVLGFRAFARGKEATFQGMLLTIGLPVATILIVRMGHPSLGALLPPGSVFQPAHGLTGWCWGPLLAGMVTLVIGRKALLTCDAELRHWYDLNHGRRLAE